LPPYTETNSYHAESDDPRRGGGPRAAGAAGVKTLYPKEGSKHEKLFSIFVALLIISGKEIILRVRNLEVRQKTSNDEKTAFFVFGALFRVHGGVGFSISIRQSLRLRSGYKLSQKYFENVVNILSYE
jgi:hypothetical protein